jgi:type I restriction enzyme R subunit
MILPVGVGNSNHFRLDRGLIGAEGGRAAGTPSGDDQAVGLTVDLSQVDLEKLPDEFAKKVSRKQTALQDIRDVVEAKLKQMLARNPQRMDYFKKCQEIIADYNREKDRATVEETFARVVDMARSLDAEQRRAVEEGLSDSELDLFDLLYKEDISKTDRERVKQASRQLLAALVEHLRRLEQWTAKEQTQAEVKIFILDRVFESLPNPLYSDEELQTAARRVYEYVGQRSAGGQRLEPAPAA